MSAQYRMGYDGAVRLSFVLVVALVTPRTSAAEPEAEAEALAAHGKFAEAATKFRTAYAEQARPVLLCNVGVAYYKAQDLPRAVYFLEQCRDIGGGLDPTFLARVDQVLAAVHAVLAAGAFTPVALDAAPADASTRIEPGPLDEPIVGRRTVWLPFGHYRAVVHAPGFRDAAVDIDAHDHAVIAIEPHLVPSPGERTPERVAEPRRAPEAATARSATASGRPHDAPARWPAIATAIGALAAGGVAIGAYVHARGQNDLAGMTTDYERYQELRASTLSWKHAAWASAGLASAGALTSAYLWYRVWHVEVTPSRAVVSLTRRWCARRSAASWAPARAIARPSAA
jgi:hypothetical protein